MLAIRPVILASFTANDFRIRRALDSLLISAKSITGDEIAGEDIAARVHTLRHLRKQVGPRRVTGGFTRLQRARGLGVKTQLTMLRFNGLVNRIGGPTDAGELVLV